MEERQLIREKKYSKTKIVHLKVEDLNSCLNLDQIALNGLWNKEQWREVLSNPLGLCFGVFQESKLIGIACGSIISDELHITTLAVIPNSRRLGFGKLIMSALINHAKSKGAIKTTLEVKKENISALRLYKGLGFKVCGCRKNYYKDGSDALILWSDID